MDGESLLFPLLLLFLAADINFICEKEKKRREREFVSLGVL